MGVLPYFSKTFSRKLIKFYYLIILSLIMIIILFIINNLLSIYIKACVWRVHAYIVGVSLYTLK